MSAFVLVANTSDLSDPGRTLLEVADRIVVLLKVGGEFFCIDDVCTHDGGPLSEGRLENHSLACPRHGAKFDIRTGKALTMPATVDTAAHEVKIEGDNVLVPLCEPGELSREQSTAASNAAAVVSAAKPAQAEGPVEGAMNPMPAHPTETL